MSRTTLLVLLILALLWLVGGSVVQALPPRLVVIQAGPVGGSFDQHAQRYAQALGEAGMAVEVQNIADTLTIVQTMQRGTPRVDIGFTAQAVNAREHPAVASAAVVELQPLFMFHRTTLGQPASPSAFTGLRLVMPPPASATAQAAIELMAQYGVTPQNTSFTHLPIQQAVQALRNGEHDAGFFMLAPANPMITELALDPGLQVYALSESVALSRRLPALRPALLARGAFDLGLLRPAQDVSLVGAPVNVIVRQDIHPAVLYALLQALDDTHQGQTLVSAYGDYPTQVGTALPLHPRAAEWARGGTPWLYKHLHPVAASLVDAYWAPVLALLALVSAVGTMRSLNELIHGLAVGLMYWALRGLQRQVDAGRRPGMPGRLLFTLAERLMRDDAGENKARLQLERLRPHLAPPGPAS